MQGLDRDARGALTAGMMQAAAFFDWPESLGLFREHFDDRAAPWEWVPCIAGALEAVGLADLPEACRDFPAGVHVEGPVYVHESVRLPPYASLTGPVFVAAGCEIRPGAYLRGNVIAGRGCVLGNSCEYKNALLLEGVETPHYNYVGDSVLGNRAHLGAGVICANLRLDRKNVRVRSPEGSVETGLRKLGAMLGDGAEAGCNAVLQPGSLLGRRAVVSSGVAFSGYLPEGTLVRANTVLERFPRTD